MKTIAVSLVLFFLHSALAAQQPEPREDDAAKRDVASSSLTAT